MEQLSKWKMGQEPVLLYERTNMISQGEGTIGTAVPPGTLP